MPSGVPGLRFICLTRILYSVPFVGSFPATMSPDVRKKMIPMKVRDILIWFGVLIMGYAWYPVYRIFLTYSFAPALNQITYSFGYLRGWPLW